jgi:hypothetical protein
MMQERTEMERDLVDGPALQLAMCPIAQRAEKFIEMGPDIEAWIRREWPDLAEEKVIRAARSLHFAILQRAVEMQDWIGRDGVVGNA